MAEEKEIVESEKKDSVPEVSNDSKKKRKGFLSRVWNGIFRIKGDDFEKRLQYISKEESAVLSRMKRRSITWRTMSRNLIVFSVLLEVIAVGYAIMTTRNVDLDWKMRALRVLPMFLLPALSSIAYSSVVSFTRMCDHRDQKTLEKLRAERQAKIDELKERTNYYNTQQLIQRYDSDPAAKAAAATILASKLGADSGLKVYLGDESQVDGKSNEVELKQSKGLRNRKQAQTRSSSAGSTALHQSDDESRHSGSSEGLLALDHNQQVVVEHHQPQGYGNHDGSWLSRIAALLVGEDPTQSYALICGNCHLHNGLVRKEDFPHITYYCPHCHALNKSKHSQDHSSGTAIEAGSLGAVSSEVINDTSGSLGAVSSEVINDTSGSVGDGENSPVMEIKDETESATTS